MNWKTGWSFSWNDFILRRYWLRYAFLRGEFRSFSSITWVKIAVKEESQAGNYPYYSVHSTGNLIKLCIILLIKAIAKRSSKVIAIIETSLNSQCFFSRIIRNKVLDKVPDKEVLPLYINTLTQMSRRKKDMWKNIKSILEAMLPTMLTLWEPGCDYCIRVPCHRASLNCINAAAHLCIYRVPAHFCTDRLYG